MPSERDIFPTNCVIPDEVLPWMLRKDGFASIGEDTTVVPIFAYRQRPIPRPVYADQPMLAEQVWTFELHRVYPFLAVEFDCIDQNYDGTILKDSSISPYLIIRMPISLLDELRGREYLGFVVAASEIRSYLG